MVDVGKGRERLPARAGTVRRPELPERLPDLHDATDARSPF
ncbi:hypothetical protein SGM_5897 [Streptomyces griseoaurantiacus M045]|uniref:Uncharacterized protein n=1 Tax=Streptomyces griseoaurantiacus M045 TaxID=996637 RepID=F3NRY3_9ACTN|nr:hypothetical protein SGM_5897 [Streptomyces griseoaurantiacus M045]